MKKLNTLLGNLEILDSRMTKKSGYGQYNIAIEIEFEGAKQTLNIHSTDSQLFDLVNGEDSHSELLLENAGSIIENEINNYISSL